jgi:uncharacterized protein (DUF2141 family)
MSKTPSGATVLLPLAAALAVVPGAGAAMPAGPYAARCAGGAGPALLVHVTGFKQRTGTIRVQTYGGDPDHYFDKGTYLKRVDLPVPAAGALDVCMPVPAPGTYAVSVRHDVDGSGHTDRADGGGMSGNPHLSLFDLLLKRKPDPAQVGVSLARGVREVPIVLNYVEGASFRPVATAAR